MHPHAGIGVKNVCIALAVIFLHPSGGLQSFAQGYGNKGIVSNFSSSEWEPLILTGKLASRLACFGPLVEESAGSSYSVSICADIPDNDNPSRVHVKNEPGHVFLLLSKYDPEEDKDTLYQAFGFYPRRPVSSVIFRNARSVILGNFGREYNASITIPVSRINFRTLLIRAAELSNKKYNINKYNCYDYALEVFNSLPGIEKLPVNHIRFPFIFGHGGSPCSLYADLKKLQENGSTWADHIRFGMFTAPVAAGK